MKETSRDLKRCRLEARGRVQGVGFRPFVHKLAHQLGLAGHVGNDARGAFIEVEGEDAAVADFIRRLSLELPEPGLLASLSSRPLPALHEAGFHILKSLGLGVPEAEVLPDTATCPACLAELFDPANRRYRYPFINCTHCGPRYSILLALPYDRCNTTMREFPMCPRCQAEYDDPADRRFHAQPNACPDCGPKLWAAYPPQGAAGPGPVEGDAILLAAAGLKKGGIVAVKGLGGFHLACLASDENAVSRLRARKGREAKPLALMAPDLEAACKLVQVNEAARAALQGAARPIVLLPRLAGAPVAASVAPASRDLGVMLPYTPLHSLLLAEVGQALVMTSGNPSSEPLCSDNAEALARLGGMADLFLLHNRGIARPVDDSVVLELPFAGGGLAPLRRARGLVPASLRLPLAAKAPVLALGGEMKSAVCLLRGDRALLSEHLGELDNPAAYRNFIAAIARLKDLCKAEPRVLACDPHPGYAATRHARTLGLPLIEVQHHHAHIAACMAEQGLKGKVVGLACDGTGWGPDSTVWGGEVLVCDEMESRRFAHLSRFPLPGGDLGARETWRPAMGALSLAYPGDWAARAGGLLPDAPREALALAAARLKAGKGFILTSSLGRLFDAVAALLGLCGFNRYEAEAAMALEAAAAGARKIPEPLPQELRSPGPEGEAWTMDPRPMLQALCERRLGGEDSAGLALAFHESMAGMLAAAALKAGHEAGLDRVALSGGCFNNRLLLSRLKELLEAAGRKVYYHSEVPCGDGGLALGQAYVAAARFKNP